MKPKTKLSFKEQRELSELPDRIEALEAERDALIAALNDPAFQLKRDDREIHEANDRLAEVERQLDQAYERWHALEELAARLEG